MYDVVLLTLAEGAGAACCGADSCDSHAKADTLRAPVRACLDALRAAGARVETVTAHADKDIDAVLARFDGPAREDGLTWPEADSKTRLVVAIATDGQLRHVVRRLVRRYAPPPSRRPADLADNRTVPDLPALAVLPMGPASADLVAQLGLPRDPAAVAAAALGGAVRRVDLLRTDAGSVTLDGALIGGQAEGQLGSWRGRVEVDDAVLTNGDDPVLACAVGNAGGYAELDGLPLLTGADPTSGQIEVAVAVPVVSRSLLGKAKVRVEVRRARGRAVAVLPRDGEIPFVDDGVAGNLTRKRSWWIEPGAWAVYTG
ncbi:diacylglycerol kinase family protein [Asanoa sp. NPDC050611]|uniref:diacylglycerol kinase family protein n=1 Tax=Asanoa sp. NPDC050611 TaxID=3157098 RepID=UPI00340D00F0